MHVRDLREEANSLECGFFIRVELPNTDAYRLLQSAEDVETFVVQHGNVEVEFDEACRVFRVPTFKVGRDEANRLKTEYCKRYGSN